MTAPQRVIIMGAAGRDFHNFNVYFRGNDAFEVVAFTATQIPGIEGRRYPADLAGALYPEGIPIYEERDLPELIVDYRIDQVIFAYSDVSYDIVMHKAALVNAAGADFRLMGTAATQLKSRCPVVSVCAARTGSGKSQTSRYIVAHLLEKGYRVIAVRHPMPYGNLSAQAVQRFSEYADLDRHDTTIEEREEYEPYIDMGAVIYAGVDYEAILRRAEDEADIIVWDGGNNDTPFYVPDLAITVVDPHRPGHEAAYYPGETNVRLADVVLVNKVDTADYRNVLTVRESVRRINPHATIVDAASPITVSDPDAIRGKRVLVVEDGPTLTHGEMTYGAGIVAAERFGAAEIVDPRPFAVGSIAATYEKYPGIGTLLPAMGYGAAQMADLEATINRSDVDLVIVATPIDLTRVINVQKPMVRTFYELQVIGSPSLESILDARFAPEMVM
jgi:predicted GTPase